MISCKTIQAAGTPSALAVFRLSASLDLSIWISTPTVLDDLPV
jgi:hypothetical protein